MNTKKNSNKHLNKVKGFLSEQVAIEYLKDNGYTILDTNWQCNFGEIDIVAQKDNYQVVVEVKGRKSCCYGTGLDSINYSKQKKISNTTFEYLKSKNDVDANVRFDAIQVDRYNQVLHVENAFYSTLRY